MENLLLVSAEGSLYLGVASSRLVGVEFRLQLSVDVVVVCDIEERVSASVG